MIPAEVYYAMPYVLAVLLAIGIPVGATLQYRLARSVSADTRIIALLVIVAFGAMITVALTPRTLNEREIALAGRRLATDLADGFSASRYINLLLVGAGAVELLRGWLQSRTAITHDPAKPILWGLLSFYVGTILVQALGSAHPDFSYKSLYMPIVLLAAYYQRIEHPMRVIAVAKLCVFALMATSLAGMVIKPDFVLHRPEPGVIPGVDFRLFGLTTHANTLGPIALVGLILELHSPTRFRPMRVAQLLAASAVLVLAQSKTSWIAGVMALVLVATPLGFAPGATPKESEASFGRAVLTLWLCIGAMVMIAIGLVLVDVSSYLERTAQVDTLTGRTRIWELTLQGWRESVMFGYGREIWGPERMAKFGLFHVGQAHNQFIQTLGEAGLVGLLLLATYLLAVFYASVQQFFASRGLVLCLLILVLARCVTEAPLSTDGVQTWSNFTNVLLIVFSCHFLRAGAAMSKVQRPTLADRAPPVGGFRLNGFGAALFVTALAAAGSIDFPSQHGALLA